VRHDHTVGQTRLLRGTKPATRERKGHKLLNAILAVCGMIDAEWPKHAVHLLREFFGFCPLGALSQPEEKASDLLSFSNEDSSPPSVT
jgi:hypothetical protein